MYSDWSLPDENYRLLQDTSIRLLRGNTGLYIPTAAFHKAIELLNQFRIVVIRGLPVSGKTAIGHALLRHFALKGYMPIVLQHCADWRDHVGGDKKQIVLLDCLFGEVKVDRDRYVEWASTFLNMSDFIKGHKRCLVVITLNTHIMAELVSMSRPGALFDDIPLVHLSYHWLTVKEKENILKELVVKHKLRSIQEDVLDVIAFARFCDDRKPGNYVNLRYHLEEFVNPAFAFTRFFSAALGDPENWKDLVPLCILAMSGSDEQIIQDEQVKDRLIDLGVGCQKLDLSSFHHRAAFLKGTLLSNDKLGFTNEALCEAFGFALFEHGHEKILLYACGVGFLVKHLQIHIPQYRSMAIVIDVKSQNYSLFLSRILREIDSGNLIAISQHPALQDVQFLVDFEEFLRQRNSLNELTAAVDSVFGMPLLYWSVWSDSGVLTQWCLERMDLASNGRTLRRTFLTACLLGKKVNTPWMMSMFNSLCENQTVLQDSISDVTLPVPPLKDRLSKELRTKCDAVLGGKTRLFCGASRDPNVTPRDPSVTPRDPSVTPRDPSVTPRDPSVTPRDPSVTPSSRRKRPLPAIPESDRCQSEDRKESKQNNVNSNIFLKIQNPSFRSSSCDGRSITPVVSETHLQSGIPIPTSIVSLLVDASEDKMVLQISCTRWYILLRLMSMCGSFDERNRDDYTLLHTAAFSGDLNVLMFLTDNGADLGCQTVKGNTALSKAVDLNQVKVAQYLIEQGQMRSAESSRDLTAPTSIKRKGRDITWMFGTRNVRDILRDTVRKNRAEMLSVLLASDLVDDEEERSSLLDFALSLTGNERVVDLLMRHLEA